MANFATSPEPEFTRADKWLWATRFYKTRALATKDCGAGKVTRLGLPVKAATSLQVGDVLQIPFPEGPGARTVRVRELIPKRVNAVLAQSAYEELTEMDVYETLRKWQTAQKEAGSKPTKRERRDIGRVRGFWD